MSLGAFLERYRAGLRPASPGYTLLRPFLRRAADEVLPRAESGGAALADRLAAGDPEARDELAELAEGTLAAMRARARAHAGDRSPFHGWLAGLDRWWRSTEEGEYIDDPDLAPEKRIRAMHRLDEFNRALGSYRFFLRLLMPLLAPDRPTRIIDLASGHGGFSLALARLARERGLELEITATDIKTEYLALGQKQAREQGLPVRFEHQDALDLSNLRPGQFDIITCTQSLHHFPPGLIAIMFAEAARKAERAVLFVDGLRTMLAAVPVYAIHRFVQRGPIIAHDGWVSFRRFFVPEELEVLARIGPWGRRANAYASPPGHCVLELRK